MRTLRLALSMLAFALAAAWPAIAAADPPRPSMSANTGSFELFGARICVDEQPDSACDVTLAPREEIVSVTEPRERKPFKLFGFITWQPVQVAQPWRDQPEIRLLAAIEN